MLMLLMTLIAVAGFVASLFWCSTRDCVALLLAAWTVAIVVFVYMNLPERHLWIPALLALAGVLGCVFVLAFPGNLTLAANVTTLVLFVVSLDVLRERSRPISLVRRRA